MSFIQNSELSNTFLKREKGKLPSLYKIGTPELQTCGESNLVATDVDLLQNYLARTAPTAPRFLAFIVASGVSGGVGAPS